MSDDLMLLTDVCSEYFNLTERGAKAKASNGLLPVPAFRIAGTKRGPFYVRKADIDAHIQRRIEQATKLNSKMREAGLV
jgi:hypothetical protein